MRPSVGIALTAFVCIAMVQCGCGGSGERDSSEALSKMLHTKLNQGEYDAVIEASTKALELSPKHRADFLMTRGIAWLRKREYDIAAKDFNEALELAPSSGALHRCRAESHAGNGRHDDAIEDCNVAIRTDPTDARAFAIRGISWQQKGQKDKAEADFKRALELEPTLFKAVESTGP